MYVVTILLKTTLKIYFKEIINQIIENAFVTSLTQVLRVTWATDATFEQLNHFNFNFTLYTSFQHI